MLLKIDKEIAMSMLFDCKQIMVLGEPLKRKSGISSGQIFENLSKIDTT